MNIFEELELQLSCSVGEEVGPVTGLSDDFDLCIHFELGHRFGMLKQREIRRNLTLRRLAAHPKHRELKVEEIFVQKGTLKSLTYIGFVKPQGFFRAPRYGTVQVGVPWPKAAVQSLNVQDLI